MAYSRNSPNQFRDLFFAAETILGDWELSSSVRIRCIEILHNDLVSLVNKFNLTCLDFIKGKQLKSGVEFCGFKIYHEKLEDCLIGLFKQNGHHTFGIIAQIDTIY